MKKFNLTVTILILILSHGTFAQNDCTADSTENVIMRAMRDELQRNMENLEYKDYSKPFFISYAIADAHTLSVNATLGSLITSNVSHLRDWIVRVMIGDYQMTDENFEDIMASDLDIPQYHQLPLDNDYYGIRRSLWESTDGVYKSASQTYKNKITAMKENNITPEDLPMADFSHTPVVKKNIPGMKFDFKKNKYENIARELSSIFNNYPEIYYSDVTIIMYYADIYFINSEGTEVTLPLSLCSLVVSAQTIADDSEVINNQIIYYFSRPEDYPDLKLLKKDAEDMVNNLIALRSADVFEDSYSGPILITDQAVARLLAYNLFTGSNSLIAYREPLYANPQMAMYYGQTSFSTESKIGKKIISDYLSVTAQPRLNKYNDIDLLGSFYADAEGVIPPDNLVLIENGILKTLLNDRTPTKKIKESNGHNRYAIMNRGFTKQIGPGVILISCTEGKSKEGLKNELIEKAKEQNLDYAIIIKPVSLETNYRPVNIYKVSLEDGSEKLIRSVNLENLGDNNLKNIVSLSNNKIVYNTVFPEGISSNMFSSFTSGMDIINGLPSSFIVPDALLLEEIEIEGINKPLSGNLPIVDNPVGKQK
jgi:hypothetical protein